MTKAEAIVAAFKQQKVDAEAAFRRRVATMLEEISSISNQLRKAKQKLTDLTYDEPVMPEL